MVLLENTRGGIMSLPPSKACSLWSQFNHLLAKHPETSFFLAIKETL